eukprot:1019739-Rhodomonas_salina.1
MGLQTKAKVFDKHNQNIKVSHTSEFVKKLRHLERELAYFETEISMFKRNDTYIPRTLRWCGALSEFQMVYYNFRALTRLFNSMKDHCEYICQNYLKEGSKHFAKKVSEIIVDMLVFEHDEREGMQGISGQFDYYFEKNTSNADKMRFLSQIRDGIPKVAIKVTRFIGMIEDVEKEKDEADEAASQADTEPPGSRPASPSDMDRQRMGKA